MRDFRRTLRARRQSWFGLKRHVKSALSLPGVHALLRLTARRVPWLRVGRLPAPASLVEVRGRAGGAEFVLMRPDRCEIAKELYWGRGRRPGAADALALDVVVALAGEADVLLDVGAYTGVFTVAAGAAHPGLRGHAFEIVPAVADALEANVERNGLADRVVVHRTGLGRPGSTMRVPTGEGGSALPSFYAPSMRFAEGVVVPFRALDDVAREAGGVDGGRRFVVKIDVEGGEVDVLRHGQDFLRERQPDVLCEVLHGVADGQELTRLLSGTRLRYYLVRDDHVEPRDSLEPDPVHRDWLLTPRGPEQLRALGVPVAA